MLLIIESSNEGDIGLVKILFCNKIGVPVKGNYFCYNNEFISYVI